jgi:hypothetical protein
VNRAATSWAFMAFLMGLTAVWVLILLARGHSGDCRYLVPVRHHAGVYVCARQP